jgi:hypothetical protein
MTAKNWEFWNHLSPTQKEELALLCRSQLAAQVGTSGGTDSEGNNYKQIVTVAPARISKEIDYLFAEYAESTIQAVCGHAVAKGVELNALEQKERVAKQNAAKEERSEEHKTAIKESVKHHTFRATDSFVREYMSAALVGESVRSVECSNETTCVISYNDYNPVGPGLATKVLEAVGAETGVEEQLALSMKQLFGALFSDPHLQEASLTSWIHIQTIGGQSKLWPALHISCTRSAAEKIDWERVTREGLQQLCKYDLLPNGRPS